MNEEQTEIEQPGWWEWLFGRSGDGAPDTSRSLTPSDLVYTTNKDFYEELNRAIAQRRAAIAALDEKETRD